MSVHRALKWSFLGEAGAKLVTPLVSIVLARLLTPSDYGVMGAVAIVISFTQIMWEAGMGRALVQYRGDRVAAANVGFWLNMVLGGASALALVVGAGAIAEEVFHDPRVRSVLQVMSFQVLLSASVSVHNALLLKDLKFKTIFWIRMATVTVPGIASIPLALLGMGYWALVVGALSGQCLQVAILWTTSGWRPSFTFNPRVARELATFGRWVALSGLLGWFYNWADSLIVGMYLGSHELGLFRTGSGFATMVFGTLFGPLMPVLYSHLAAVSRDPGVARSTMIRVIRVLTFVSIPIATAIAACSSVIAENVFGIRWEGLGQVILWMALTNGVAWVVGANGEAYRAAGSAETETKVMVGALIFYVVGYWLSIHWGLKAFLWARFSLAVAAMVVHLLVIRAVLGINLKDSLRYVMRVGALCAGVVSAASFLPVGSTSRGQLIHASVVVLGLAAGLFVWERRGIIPELVALAKRTATQ